MKFARKFENMDEDTAKRIMEFLENMGSDNRDCSVKPIITGGYGTTAGIAWGRLKDHA